MEFLNYQATRDSITASRSPRVRITPRARRIPTTADGITYKVADNFSERCAAFHLVHKAYAQRGLISPNGLGLRLSARQLLPDSVVFVALENKRVICTISLIRGRGMGLLLEREFGPEVDQLRQQSATLAEVTSLASAPRENGEGVCSSIVLNLFRLVHAYAAYNQLEHLLIAVHPRHSKFYRRFLNFPELGAQRPCHRVMGNPAVACVLQVDQFTEDACPLRQRLPELAFQPWELENRPIPPVELEYFAAAWGDLNSARCAA